MKPIIYASVITGALLCISYFVTEFTSGKRNSSQEMQSMDGGRDSLDKTGPAPPSAQQHGSEQQKSQQIFQGRPPSPASAEIESEEVPDERENKTTAYYAGLEALNGSALKAALNQRIRNHRVLPYSQLWNALRALDAGDRSMVILIYDRTQRSCNKNGGNQGDWNREHLWPRGYGVRRSSAANTDLHHVRASDVAINALRGHLYFDETDGEDFGGIKFSFDNDSWEPPNEVKGDIARALFYMAVRYEGNESQSVDLELSDTPNMQSGVHGKLSTLLKWHQDDPVSDAERTRNNKIHRHYQGNRNPFIDHPEWVEKVFGATP